MYPPPLPLTCPLPLCATGVRSLTSVHLYVYYPIPHLHRYETLRLSRAPLFHFYQVVGALPYPPTGKKMCICHEPRYLTTAHV